MFAVSQWLLVRGPNRIANRTCFMDTQPLQTHGPALREPPLFGLMLCYRGLDFHKHFIFEVVFHKSSSMEQWVACHVCLLSSLVPLFVCGVHDGPWAKTSGGVHWCSVRLKVNIIRETYLNKTFSQPRKYPHKGRRKKKNIIFYWISIQPECNRHHRQSTKEIAGRNLSRPDL